ncbi:prenyltransferase/squalene oxidase repeat-containing protein [Nocardioides marmorisolisilvae]|uniref:Squalene cyclase C-terminal domain-containing protein n=1 Tax=Nocardioides marmorisolisilvae TaxID=1542737 RepID=A0A3N0DWQ8_9ACTN|nr:prenyltransferase/squalene oxidase repeat-containing protein [Nocardioides marmorisolisilvae]RNL79926.1 hypothetical protein EFL95_13410 [Nocardioides marmorisolisilvae]
MSVLRRGAALVAAAALSGAGLAVVTTAPAEAAGTDPRPVSVGASWLADHLVNGVISDSYVDNTDPENPVPVAFDDLGLTMDTAMSLVAVGGHASTVSTIKSAMDARITETYDSFGTTYTGSAAKAAVYDRLVGGDPTDVGGDHTDLVKVVEDNTDDAAPVAGRIENVNDSFGDTNTFGQAFAARALAEAGSDKAADAEAFLLDQQCDAGFFRLNPNPDRAAEDQTCQAEVGTDASAPDTDATAIAMLQLEALATKSQAVTDALTAARDWLLDAQRADGSFGGGPSTSDPNANSTALAGQALAGLGETAAVKAAAIWVRALQADEVGACTSQLSSETGGIGYDASTVADGRADGITASTKDRWLRTTAPALPILKYAPAVTPDLNITGPAGYVSGGHLATYRISGIVPGDKVCVAGFGRHKVAVGRADGTATVYLTAPNKSESTTVRVSDRGGNSSGVRTNILTATTLTVAPSPSVAKRNSYITVTVSGLAAGESAKVVFRGASHSGHADPKGVFRVRVGVGSVVMSRTVAAYGQFTNRKGSHLVKVVR